MSEERLAFSTVAMSTVHLEDGSSLTLRPDNAYSVDRATGHFALLLDGDALGIRELDSLDVSPSGTIVFSTATDHTIRQRAFLKQQDAYSWNPATGEVRLALDGGTLGPFSLDAPDLGAILPLRLAVPGP
jgi:hypothetical protein